MTDDAESKVRHADDSQSSLVENLSEKAIRKELRSNALQHPTTILPLALCILSGIYLLTFGLIFGGSLVAIILLVCSGLVALSSFLWHYSIRFSRAYTGRVQEVIELQEKEQEGLEREELKQSRETLESGFSNINSDEGLKALRELIYEYEQLQDVLDRKKETDSVLIAQIPDLAEGTYRQGLSVLADALELARVIHSSDRERLKTEMEELEKEIESLKEDETRAAQVEIREATVTSHQERLNMIEEQDLQLDKLLYQSDRCEASLHRTRIELASLRAESSEVSVSAVTETLEQTINQTKEVQAELRKLGF